MTELEQARDYEKDIIVKEYGRGPGNILNSNTFNSQI